MNPFYWRTRQSFSLVKEPSHQMRIKSKTAAWALLTTLSASVQATTTVDERLVGLWRGTVEGEEWVLMFSADTTVRGLIGHSKFGVGLADDSFRYRTVRQGAIDRLDVTKVGTAQEAPSMSFVYRLQEPNRLDLVPFDSSAAPETQVGDVGIPLFRTPMSEEVQAGSETVMVKRTALMWQISTSERQISWEDAQTYCRKLRIGGFADWRLPHQSELASILDIVNFHVALAARRPPILEALAKPDSGYMFSGTPVPKYTNAPWVMNLANGHIFNGQGYAAYARCVRAANP